jgi:hypothetical protein
MTTQHNDPERVSTAQATYLGDGLYVSHDRWQVELFACNGIEKTNRVFLDPPALAAFLRYVEPLRARPRQD